MKLKATREGKRLVLAVLVVGFAALNTGNNLMYLIFSMLLAVVLISLFLPYINLKALEADFEIEEPVHAGVEIPVKISITNKRQLFPSYSVRFTIPGILDRGLYIEQIKPYSTQEFETTVTFKKRGYVSITDFRLNTSFPFIFFHCSKKPEGKKGVLVYPELMAVEEDIFKPSSISSETGRISRTDTEEIQSLREYRHGDSIKSIHWKATAKKGELMVKETYESEPRNVTVVLDNTAGQNNDNFEKAVSLAASISAELIKNGYSLRFITCAKTIPFGSGMEHLLKILDLLAVITMVRHMDCPISELEKGTLFLILSSNESPFNRYRSHATKLYYAHNL